MALWLTCFYPAHMNVSRVAVIACAVALSLSGCGTGEETTDPTKLDSAGKFACEDFANGYKSAVTQQARVELANKVAKWAPSSHTNRIADMSEALGRAADGSPEAWRIAADAFAQACLDGGAKSS